MAEPVASDVESIVEPLSRALAPYLDRPFALFGHSMGAMLCFELARTLASAYGVQPALLISSGWRSPDVMEKRRDYDLEDEDFVTMLRDLNGTPEELLQNREMLELLLPILRADFYLTQTYRYVDGDPLACPIRVYGGSEDRSVPAEILRPWKNLTTGPFSMSIIPGDHFFLHQSQDQFLRLLAADLADARDRNSTKSPSLSFKE
jgi:medium-chain acyl-[acyl-carrier-protein] hydrolase